MRDSLNGGFFWIRAGHDSLVDTACVCVRRAVIGLKFLQQGITNFKALQAQGFRGWDFSTSPCQGWTGVTCDASGRVAKLCASLAPVGSCPMGLHVPIPYVLRHGRGNCA